MNWGFVTCNSKSLKVQILLFSQADPRMGTKVGLANMTVGTVRGLLFFFSLIQSRQEA